MFIFQLQPKNIQSFYCILERSLASISSSIIFTSCPSSITRYIHSRLSGLKFPQYQANRTLYFIETFWRMLSSTNILFYVCSWLYENSNTPPLHFPPFKEKKHEIRKSMKCLTMLCLPIVKAIVVCQLLCSPPFV